jgi:hypothetical protein
MEGADMATVQNTLIVIGDNTVSANIKPALVGKLQRFEKATGYSFSDVLDRSVELFMEIEAPVYRAECKGGRRRRQHA